MDHEESLETKCENMMSIVVESRKRFGKMCADYEKKTLLMENKILNMQIETFPNYKFKPKQPLPAINDDDSKELEDFSVEMLEREKRMEELRRKIKNTQEVVAQIRVDNIGRRLREPLTADVLLANVQIKKAS